MGQIYKRPYAGGHFEFDFYNFNASVRFANGHGISMQILEMTEW